jgi:hypothetical protein
MTLSLFTISCLVGDLPTLVLVSEVADEFAYMSDELVNYFCHGSNVLGAAWELVKLSVERLTACLLSSSRVLDKSFCYLRRYLQSDSLETPWKSSVLTSAW